MIVHKYEKQELGTQIGSLTGFLGSIDDMKNFVNAIDS